LGWESGLILISSSSELIVDFLFTTRGSLKAAVGQETKNFNSGILTGTLESDIPSDKEYIYDSNGCPADGRQH
ncbi:MAG TPA: hypothetical protein DCL86_15445, partial [Bacteroidales bacterium]|nr:hypothetical protein [Bacteroidales bacterium]